MTTPKEIGKILTSSNGPSGLYSVISCLEKITTNPEDLLILKKCNDDVMRYREASFPRNLNIKRGIERKLLKILNKHL